MAQSRTARTSAARRRAQTAAVKTYLRGFGTSLRNQDQLSAAERRQAERAQRLWAAQDR